MATIRFSGSPDELVDAVNRLVAALAGSGPDVNGAAILLKTEMAMALMGKIQDAYEVKSGGGTDAMGIKWQPLAASTLALRKIVSSSARVKRLQGQTLSPERKKLVAEHAQRLSGVVFKTDAASLRSARNILERKYRAGKVSKSYYQSKKRLLADPKKVAQAQIKNAANIVAAGSYAQILRDTGRLFRSFTPRTGNSDQIVRHGPGWFEIGSNVPYFGYHQSAQPRKRLPRRQVLPDANQQLPDDWVNVMVKAAYRKMKEVSFWRLLLGKKVA